MYSKDESKELRTLFWHEFQRYSSPKRRAVDLPKRWMLDKTGIKAVSLKFEIDRQCATVGLEIYASDVDRHQAFYHKFVSLQNLLEAELPHKLIWEDLYTNSVGKEVSRIYRQLDGVDIFRRSCWEEVFLFFLETMLPLELFFIEYREFIKDV